ncbi:MAG: hypothetical protein WCP89_01470 [archaeon]
MINPRVRDTLINVAKFMRPGTEGIIFYEPLNLHCALDLDFSRDADRVKIGKVLDEISRYEISGGRPLLSAVVVQKDTMRPGKGFGKLVDALGLSLPGEDGDTQYIRLLTDVHKYWRTH